jgi:hypothetical protein
MCELLELVPQVEPVIKRLDSWCRDHVGGFPGLDTRSYAACLAYHLCHGGCGCGRAKCPQEHCLAARADSRLSLTGFLYRAVIGPGGLVVNSIVQGMAYPLLRQEVQLRHALVEWKHCPGCAREYEGGKCPFCHRACCPADTPLVGRDWFVIPGVYEEVRRWGCGPKECRHYYAQDRCREERWVDYPDATGSPVVRYRSRHHPAGCHDLCPLGWCRECGPRRHAERGTTLWVRAARLARPGPAAPARPGLADALREGMSRALAGWDDDTRRRLGERFGTDRAAMAESLVQEDQSFLTPPQREQLKRHLQQALADRDIGAEDA